MSGTTFAENVKKLIDSQMVSFKEVKNNKNVSNYYFLTDLGRTIFEKRFESFSGDVHIDKKPVLEMFKLSGWTIGEEIGGVVELSNATSKPISLHFITTYD